MPQPPSGTVTFLFTDIEGSTTRWEHYPRSMQHAFASQESILRRAVESNGGYLYKMIGDAFQAAFPTAPLALQAAIEAQRALHSENWPADIGEVKVRMALHTGVTEERGDDYVGPVLNRAARLLSAGYGGQVLLSTSTYELVRDLLPEGISLLDLGERRLKDLIRPEHVFQVAIPDVPSEFPPLKTLEYHANNLPRQTTALIGREKEVSAVCALLRRPDVTLMALLGPGGIGKTRLALQTAAEVLDDFPDGVWLVELAALTDASLVVPTIAAVLDVRESPGQSLTQTLQLYLRDKKLLLVLDTFEQVTGAASQVNDLLSAASAVKAVVTSREPLHLYGEWDYQVPPLALPDARRLPPVEKLSQYEAVRLFVERAQAGRADFQVNNENAPAVAEICVRLDGLPLAIELAAARIRLLPPQAMLARLQDRFKLLSGGARDLPLRQQTIRNAIDWSYDMLSEEEKQLFRRTSVFQGASTLDAVEAVSDFDSAMQIDVLEGVESLVDRSLLRQQVGNNQQPLLSMLETIHEFARDKNREEGEEKAQALHRAHALYFMSFTEMAESHLRGEGQAEWLDRLEQEYDNLRAALHWAIETANHTKAQGAGAGAVDTPEPAEIALRIAGGLWRFWSVRGYLSEGREQLARALSLPNAQPAQAESTLRIKALNGAGHLAYRQTNYDEARSLFGAALALGRQTGDKTGVALALNNLGVMNMEQGDHETARALYEESLAIRRELGDKYGMGATLSNLAIIAQEQEKYEVARPLLEEALAIARQIGDKLGIAAALINSGVVAKDQGDYLDAQKKFEESLDLEREMGNSLGIALSLGNLAEIAKNQGSYDAALSLYKEGLALLQELGDRYRMAWLLEGLAAAGGLRGESDRERESEREREGDSERAARLWGAAEALREAIGSSMPPNDRSQYERDVSVVRSRLGEVAFEKAWQEGRAMSMDQAIKHALQEN